MLFRQLFQHVRSGGIAGLGLLSARKLHFPEQNLAQLLGRIDVERLPRLFVNALFQLSDPLHQRIPIVLQSLRIRPDPFHFHIVKHPGEWHLNFRKQLLHIGLLQLLLKHGPGFPDGIHRVARIFQKFLRLFDKRLLPAAFPQKQAFFLYGQIQMFMGDIRNAVVIFQRVQQVGRDQHIEQTIRLHPLKITVLELDLEGGKAHALLSQRGQTASHIICRNLLRPGKNPDLLIPGCKCQRRKTASVIPVGSGSRRLISILQHQKGCPSFLSRPDKGCFRLCPCSGNPIVLLSALIGSRLFLKSAQHVLKLQLLEQRIGFRREHLSKLHIVPCHGELRLRVDPRQRPGELRQIPVGGKGFFDALFRHLVQMRIDIVQRTKTRHQLLRRFGSHLRHTGNIVRGIPHEGLQIHELLRGHLPGRKNVLRIVILDFRSSSLCLRNPDLDVFPGDLEQIPVAGNKSHLHAVPFAALCQGTQNVICLQSRLLYRTDSHRSKHFLHHRDLLPELLRHGLSRSFILCIQFVPECGCMYIKGHSKISRILFLQNLKHNVKKAINCVGVKPLRITQIRHTIERAVQYAVPVNQYQLFAHHFLHFKASQILTFIQNTSVVITRITISTAKASK